MESSRPSVGVQLAILILSVAALAPGTYIPLFICLTCDVHSYKLLQATSSLPVPRSYLPLLKNLRKASCTSSAVRPLPHWRSTFHLTSPVSAAHSCTPQTLNPQLAWVVNSSFSLQQQQQRGIIRQRRGQPSRELYHATERVGKHVINSLFQKEMRVMQQYTGHTALAVG